MSSCRGQGLWVLTAGLLVHSAPCTPANVQQSYSCETGVALLSWEETLGRSSFYARVSSGDHESSCSSTQTSCPLPSLLCGRTYDVEVIAVGDHCNSGVAGMTQIETGTEEDGGCWFSLSLGIVLSPLSGSHQPRVRR